MHAPNHEFRTVSIPSTDGLTLQARYWSLADPRAVMVVVHGFGEHGGCYSHVAEAVALGAGVEVLAVDLRGHGRSPGPRGFVRNYDDLTNDLLAAVEWVQTEHPGLPRIILGHSNGGQVALRAALRLTRNGNPPAGLILSNPSLRLSFPVPKHKLALGRMLLRVAPRVTLPAPIQPEKLSRDVSQRSFYLDDPLRHARMSAPLFFGMVEGGERLLGQLEGLDCRVLMIVGGQDPVVDSATCQLAFERIGSTEKSLLLYPQMLHEPFNELGREGVISDVVEWLERQLPGIGAGVAR
ncbi:MAG: alpha/beta hydrolase [Isosphaeraceae bacterium]